MSDAPHGETTFDEPEYARWRSEADRALQGARVQANAGLHNWACFAAEQSAQLALKGLLHAVGKGPWGHDLVSLAALAQDGGISVPGAVVDATRRLGRHYIATRHPDAHAAGPPGPHYGETDARDAIDDAQTIIALVDDAWRALRG